MNNEINTEKYLLEAIGALKEDQKEAHRRLEQTTKEFYEALKEHMDHENIRWDFVRDKLQSISERIVKLETKANYNSKWSDKLTNAVLSIITAGLVVFFFKS